MQTSNNQFRVASENLTDIAIVLIEKDFKEHDPCVSEFDKDSKMIIDTKNKTYYFLDDECLKDSSEIIKHKFNTSIEPVKLDEIITWN